MTIPATLPWSDGTGPSCEDQYSDLAMAIVTQATRDYIQIFQKLWKKDNTLKMKRMLLFEKEQIEDFFHSDWYEFLTDLDPDMLLNGCRQRAVEKEKEKIKKQNKRKMKKLLMKAAGKDGIPQ